MMDCVEPMFLHSFVSHFVTTPPTTIHQVTKSDILRMFATTDIHDISSKDGINTRPKPIRVIPKKTRKRDLLYHEYEGGNCFCRVCYVRLESKSDLRYHRREVNHLNNLLKVVKGEYRCALCPDQVIGSESSIISHLYGEEHVNNLIDNNNDAVKKFSKEINSEFRGTGYIKNLFIEMEAIRFNFALANEFIEVKERKDGKITKKCSLCNVKLPRDDSALRTHIKGRKHKYEKLKVKKTMSLGQKVNL